MVQVGSRRKYAEKRRINKGMELNLKIEVLKKVEKLIFFCHRYRKLTVMVIEAFMYIWEKME